MATRLDCSLIASQQAFVAVALQLHFGSQNFSFYHYHFLVVWTSQLFDFRFVRGAGERDQRLQVLTHRSQEGQRLAVAVGMNGDVHETVVRILTNSPRTWAK